MTVCVRPFFRTDSDCFDSFVGEVTDVRIAKTAKGESRVFGFVGFRSNEQAQAAVQYFHNSYIGSAKMTVEMAVKVGDTSIESAAMSKHTKKKLARDVKKAATNDITSAEGNGESTKVAASKAKKANTGKKDFLDAMKPRSSGNYWANDETADQKEMPADERIPMDSDNESDDDDVNSIFPVITAHQEGWQDKRQKLLAPKN